MKVVLFLHCRVAQLVEHHSAGGHPNGIVDKVLIPAASEVGGSSPPTATFTCETSFVRFQKPVGMGI